jgi:VWFA-related protein
VSRIVAALVIAVATAPGAAQEPPRPVFPADVELASIDVTVVDANGAPVRDLRPEDFTLTVEGQPRRVVSAEFVAQSGEATVADAPPVPSHFSTNEGLVAGRLVLIAVDTGNIEMGGGRETARAAGALLDRLGLADRVGLLTLPGPDPREEFTSDKARVRAALTQVAGRGRQRNPQISFAEALAFVEQDERSRWQDAVERECPDGRELCVMGLESDARTLVTEHRFQAERSVSMLEAAFKTLEPIEARKVMVLVSQGLSLPDSDSFARPTPRLRQLAAAASRARVSLYAVRVRGGSGPGAGAGSSRHCEEERFLQEQGLESLAAMARGTVLRGSPEQAFERLAREISGYYLLGFEPAPRDREGRQLDVRVGVSRPGSTVRARTTMAIAPAAGPKAEEQALVASLRSPVAATAIPLRVTTYAVREEQGDNIRVLVSGEIGREHIPGVAVACALFDERGLLAASAAQRARTDGVAGTGPMPFSAVLSVPPSRYTLRMAVRDRLGRQGSVEHDVSAAVTSAGDLEYSDLLLALPPTAGTALRPGLGLERHEGILLAHLQLYGAGSAAAEVRVEVAREAGGPSLLEVPARLADTRSPGHRVAQALLPVGDLPPGDYFARAIVSVAGSPVGKAAHPLRLTPH